MEHVKQHDRAWVDQATPAEIDDALKAGELSAVLGREAPIDFDATVRQIDATTSRAPQPAPGQGAESGPAPQGSWREQQIARLETMDSSEVAAAMSRHEFDDLLRSGN